jgi:hypothetical protein
MKEYKIVVLSDAHPLATRHLYGELVDAKRQATRDLHKYKGLQVYVYRDKALVAKRCQDTPRYHGFWMDML